MLLNLTHRRWHPSAAQREAAIREMPCLAGRAFNHQRVDDSRPQAYTFVRRSAYYAAFNSGAALSGKQRLGLGMLWSDRHGALMQSQSGSRDAAWGARPAGADNVLERAVKGAEFTVDGKKAEQVPGARDLPQGDLAVDYPLGDRGRKVVSFHDDAIEVAVEFEGSFVEQVPLLIPEGARLEISDGRATLSEQDAILTVKFTKGVEASRLDTDVTVAGKALRVLRLQAEGGLTYRLEL